MIDIINEIITIIDENTTIIILAMAGILLLFFILIISLFISKSKLNKRYNSMMRGNSGKTIEDTIEKYMEIVEEIKEDSDRVMSYYDGINERLEQCVQKVGIKRYKAFDNVGSDLSFSVALLNDHDNGIVLTSIFGRQESTVYAKPIDSGLSRYELSEEEAEALRLAITSDINMKNNKEKVEN